MSTVSLALLLRSLRQASVYTRENNVEALNECLYRWSLVSIFHC